MEQCAQRGLRKAVRVWQPADGDFLGPEDGAGNQVFANYGAAERGGLPEEDGGGAGWGENGGGDAIKINLQKSLLLLTPHEKVVKITNIDCEYRNLVLLSEESRGKSSLAVGLAVSENSDVSES